MTEGKSDIIIAISVIIGGLLARRLPSKIKWWWRLLIGLLAAIALSVIAHLIAKTLLI